MRVKDRVNWAYRPPSRWALEKQIFEQIAFFTGIQWVDYSEQSRRFTRWNAPAWFPTPVTNAIAPRVGTMMSQLLRSRPAGRVRPDTNDPEDREAADVADKLLGHFDDVTNEDMLRQDAAGIAALTGTVLFKDIFNPRAGRVLKIPRMTTQLAPATDPMTGQPHMFSNGQPAMTVQQVPQTYPDVYPPTDAQGQPHPQAGLPHPQAGQPVVDEVPEGEIQTLVRMIFNFYWDPKATDLEKAQWCGEAVYADLNWIDQNFPEQGPYVAAESGIDSANFFESSLLALVGPSIQGTAHYGGTQYYTNGAVLRFYEEKPSQEYPKGLYVVVANDVLLYQGDLPLVDENGTPTGDFSWTMFRYDVVPGRFPGRCYDDQTEVLTRRGWLPFADVDATTDEVATRNPETKAFEWQRPSRIVDEPYSGEMYRFHSQSVDLLVTPEHRMLVTRYPYQLGGSSKRWGECVLPAEELATAYNSKVAIPMTSEWDGRLIGKRVFARYSEARRAVGDIPNAGAVVREKPLAMSGDDYCAFMGAYLSEGWCEKGYEACIAQQPTSRGYGPFGQLVSRILGRPAPYDGRAFRVSRVGLCDFLSQFGHARDKYIPDDIMEAPREQLRLFWDHFVLGDGNYDYRANHSGRGQHPRRRECITTTSKQMAGQLQEIAQKLGWSASVGESLTRPAPHSGPGFVPKPIYRVRVRYSRTMGFRATKTHYEGRIHCVTVPNGIVYVRRNGKPAWCGNSPTEDMVPLQRRINGIDAQIVLNRKTLTNPWILAPKGSGLNPSQVGMRPGAVILYNYIGVGAAPQVVPGTPLPAQIYEERQACFTAMDQLAQDSRISIGQMPPGVKSGIALNFLREQAEEQGVPRLQRWGQCMAERGRKRLLLAQQHYQEDRAVKVIGQGSDWQVHYWKGADLQGNTDVTVDPASLIPRSRSAEIQTMMDALESGLLNPMDPVQRQKMLEKIGLTEFDTEVGPDRRRQRKEMALMDQGQPVEIGETDNDEIHLLELLPKIKDPSFDAKNPAAQMAYMQHYREHKMRLMMRMASQFQAQNAQGAPPGQAPGGGGPPGAGGPPHGAKPPVAKPGAGQENQPSGGPGSPPAAADSAAA